MNGVKEENNSIQEIYFKNALCRFASLRASMPCGILDKWWIMDIRVNDKIILKKEHPCKNREFEVLRVGMDFKIRCTKCGREVRVLRKKIEHNIKTVYRDGEKVDV